MGFMDVVLPVAVSLGSSGGVSFKTDIVVYGNGQEYVNSRWQYQRGTFDLQYIVKNRAQALEVYNFFLAAKGRFNYFRVKDYLDNSSASNGVDAPTAIDQPIGVGDGANITFQLTKSYDNGVSSYTRKVTKPIAGTVLVAVNGTPTTNFTINNNTGIISLTTPPAIGEIITAGFEFHVPCRFDQDSLQGITPELLRKTKPNEDYFSMPSVSVIEVLD